MHLKLFVLPIKNLGAAEVDPPSNFHLAIQTAIHFPIKAAVEFVARGASIRGLDGGDLGRNGGRCSYFCSYFGGWLLRIFKNPLFLRLERVKGIEPSSQAWEARILPLNHTRFHWANLYQNSCPRATTDFLTHPMCRGEIPIEDWHARGECRRSNDE